MKDKRRTLKVWWTRKTSTLSFKLDLRSDE